MRKSTSHRFVHGVQRPQALMKGMGIIMELTVGLGEYIVSGNKEDILRTYALGSCVAVTAYSYIRKVAGMIHLVLPSPLEIRDRIERPAYFAETGIPLLINRICSNYGCRKEELRIRIYGGADSIQSIDHFKVGKRNVEAAVNALSIMGLIAYEADLRGYESRTLTMDVASGTVKVNRLPIKI